MIELRLKVKELDFDLLDDIKRIQNEFAARGYQVSQGDVVMAYSAWSEETYCASWLILSGKPWWVVDALMPYLEPVQPLPVPDSFVAMNGRTEEEHP